MKPFKLRPLFRNVAFFPIAICNKTRAKLKNKHMQSLQSALELSIMRCDWEKSILLFNELWKIQGKHIQASFVEDQYGIFKITNTVEGRSAYVTSLTRSDWLYSNGFNARARHIAASYAIDIVDINDDDIVIDCGANYGDISLYLDFIGVRARYIAIEPSPLDFKCLCLNLKQTKQDYFVEHIALSDRPGRLDFYIDRERASSSLLCPPSYSEVTSVDVQTLDMLCNRTDLKHKRIKLLKLEAEGLEPEICKGMDKTLERIEYIAADLGPERGLGEELTAPAVINYLLQRGFEVKEFGDRTSLRILFVNRRLVS